LLAAGGVGSVPVNSGWQIAGIGDFNDDGKSDILWQNSNDGTVAIWEMNGFQITAAGGVGAVAPNSGWQIVGTGDYFGDGHGGILWQNTANNAIGVWEMNGLQIGVAQGLPMALPKNSSIVTS
jgi:hypothetical protein